MSLRTALSGENVYNICKEKYDDIVKNNIKIIKQYDKIIGYNIDGSIGTIRETAKQDTKTILSFYLRYVKSLFDLVAEIKDIVNINLTTNTTKYNNQLIKLIDKINTQIKEINKRIKHMNSKTHKTFLSKCTSCFSTKKSPIEGGKKKLSKRRRNIRKYEKI